MHAIALESANANKRPNRHNVGIQAPLLAFVHIQYGQCKYSAVICSNSVAMEKTLCRLWRLILSLSVFFYTAEAFWRMNCAVVQTSRVDPIVNPGALSQHVHSIVGGVSKSIS